MNSEDNGYATQDKTREERRQEEQGQEHLQRKARADATGDKRKRDRIVYIENTSNIRDPFIIEKVDSVEDLIQKICVKFPDICLESIGMKVSNSRMGTMHRQHFTEEIPYEYDTMYITLFLKKHPSFSESKIERLRQH